jgi:hypothetical protein
MTTIVRAWEQFRGLYGEPYDHGVMSWDVASAERRATCEGDEFAPNDEVGSVGAGDGEDGVAMSIGVDSFGRVRRLLVADGETVFPGQPLMEYDERPPTTEEWQAEWDRRYRAECRVYDLERALDNPFRAFWYSLTGRR